MSIGSTDYKYLKYTISNTPSINHPSHYDRDVDSFSLSSFESLDSPPSKSRSATQARIRSSQYKSFLSEPNKKIPLTEKVLAIHNQVIPYNEEQQEEYDVLEQSLLNRVDEKCKTIQQELDEKLKQLEEQFTKAEQDFNQSRTDLEQLHSMEKEYMNQAIQTDLHLFDVGHMEHESKKVAQLQQFVETSRKIIWDTPFIPLNSICRQLPTSINEDEDEDDVYVGSIVKLVKDNQTPFLELRKAIQFSYACCLSLPKTKMNNNKIDINPDRPLLVGPEVPTSPFPFALKGTVVKGYGRGSKQLGIPTANLSDEAISALVSGLETGVYYGWTQVGELNSPVYPMVMSLGWNPYFKNERRSAEVHVIHDFLENFYDTPIRVLVLGYIRAEQNYPSLDALIKDIKTDVEVARRSLTRRHYVAQKEHNLFSCSATEQSM